ncbi:MAG: hydrogenase maturation protease, partial [Terriglobales bacterium]
GIRCLDLAYSLAGGWSAVIVLDAVSRSSVPGTLFRITLEDEPEPAATLNAHNVGVEHVRALAARMAIALPPMFLIGCEPAALEPVAGDRPSLSPPVAAALPHALAMAEALARECFASHNLEVVHS